MKVAKDLKKDFKERNGITLIALVITIIVLLILSGVSIMMLTGDNSILNKATNAKTQTERKDIIETARIDILGKQTENRGSLTEEELEDILTSSNYSTQGTLSDNGEESILDKTLTSKDGKYTIPVSEIYNGSLSAGKTRLTSLITSASMYGYEVTNYSANGVNNWSVLYNDGNNIYILSDDYITESISSYSLSADAVAYMKDDTQWTQYVDSAVPTAKAYGGPTGDMLLASYNAKYGTDYSLLEGRLQLDTTDSLYVITRDNKYEAYRLATTAEETTTGELLNKSIEIANLANENIILDVIFFDELRLAGSKPSKSVCAWSVFSNGNVDYGDITRDGRRFTLPSLSTN